MEHNILTQLLYLVGSMILGGGAAVAYGRRGGANSGFLMNQGRSRISNAIGRSNTRDNNTSEAEGILIETAKMSVQDRDNAHKQANEFMKLLLDANYRLGKAEAKAEILEKEKFPKSETDSSANDMFLHNPLFETQEATEQESPKANTLLPERPLEEAGNAQIEITDKSQRKKHLLTENRDELENDNWTIQPIGEARTPRRPKG